MNGLVGGLFLSYLLNDDSSCDDKAFMNLFFAIG